MPHHSVDVSLRSCGSTNLADHHLLGGGEAHELRVGPDATVPIHQPDDDALDDIHDGVTAVERAILVVARVGRTEERVNGLALRVSEALKDGLVAAERIEGVRIHVADGDIDLHPAGLHRNDGSLPVAIGVRDADQLIAEAPHLVDGTPNRHRSDSTRSLDGHLCPPFSQGFRNLRATHSQTNIRY